MSRRRLTAGQAISGTGGASTGRAPIVMVP
jgi:hypothetical protein